MLNHQPPFLKPPVLNALWQLCERTSAECENASSMRNSLVIISMAAAKQPTLVSARLDLLLKVGQQPESHIRVIRILSSDLGYCPVIPDTVR
jgi:hypothetical protein